MKKRIPFRWRVAVMPRRAKARSQPAGRLPRRTGTPDTRISPEGSPLGLADRFLDPAGIDRTQERLLRHESRSHRAFTMTPTRLPRPTAATARVSPAAARAAAPAARHDGEEQIQGERRFVAKRTRKPRTTRTMRIFSPVPRPSAPAGPRVVGRGCGLGRPDSPIDGCDQRSDASPDRAVAIARLDPGHDRLPDDPRRDRIGYPVLEAIAHLDPDLPVVQEQEEDQAVIEPLAANVPGRERPNGEVLERHVARRPAAPYEIWCRSAARMPRAGRRAPAARLRRGSQPSR